jgi:hypothetical protein
MYAVKKLNVATPPKLTDAVTAGADITVIGFRIRATGAGAVKTPLMPLGSSAPRAFTVTTADTVTCPSHGLANDDRVWVGAAGTVALPTGLAAGYYFVINVSGDTFQVSATQGGSAVDVTAAGIGVCKKVAAVTLPEGGKMELADQAVQITLAGLDDTLAASILDAQFINTDVIEWTTDGSTVTDRLAATVSGDWESATTV